MLVNEFIDGFNNLKKPDLQKDFCKQHLTKTYASIVQKNALLKSFIDACVKTNANGILYLDMVANKINFTYAVICLYTDLQLDTTEDGRHDIITAYDKMQEFGVIDIFCELIGEREINELLMVNKECLDTWHEEHSSARSFVSELTDKAVRTFVEMAALMKETVTTEDQEKFGETLKSFIGVSNK